MADCYPCLLCCKTKTILKSWSKSTDQFAQFVLEHLLHFPRNQISQWLLEHWFWLCVPCWDYNYKAFLLHQKITKEQEILGVMRQHVERVVKNSLIENGHNPPEPHLYFWGRIRMFVKEKFHVAEQFETDDRSLVSPSKLVEHSLNPMWNCHPDKEKIDEDLSLNISDAIDFIQPLEQQITPVTCDQMKLECENEMKFVENSAEFPFDPTVNTSYFNKTENMTRAPARKRYKCEHCVKSYTFKSNLNRHLEKKHSYEPNKFPNQFRSCVICQQVFDDFNQLIDHFKSVHNHDKTVHL